MGPEESVLAKHFAEYQKAVEKARQSVTQNINANGNDAAHSAPVVEDIRERMAQLIPIQQARHKELKAKENHPLGSYSIGSTLGGMRGMSALVWDVSNLDAEEGIRFRGHSIPELQAKLPAAVPGGEPLPEGLLWLFLTGEIPTAGQAAALSKELASKAAIPDFVSKALDAIPAKAHPMTQLTVAIMALQADSVFAKAYQDGIHKSQYWKPMLEDCLNLIAKLPALAALIYRRTFHPDKPMPAPDPNLDWAANLAHMMGYDNPEVYELFRLYLTIHSDHEGGNVTAHTTHLVGSTLADPYLCLAAGMNGLAGPLHGLASQEVLRWLFDLEAAIGDDASLDTIRDYCKETMAKGKVIPGYGHAVLRVTDPRYMCQREFAVRNLGDYPLFKTVAKLYDVVPAFLFSTGKVRNPWPNVDAHSSVLLQYYGITEETYYTVMFGVSRALGVLSQLIWDRALGLPIERPKSVTTDQLFAALLVDPKKAATQENDG